MQHFPMKTTGHVTNIFFRLLGVICRFIIKIRIEVHFFSLHWEMKGHWSRVNLVKRFARLTPDQCPFISQCKEKKCTSILNWSIYTLSNLYLSDWSHSIKDQCFNICCWFKGNSSKIKFEKFFTFQNETKSNRTQIMKYERFCSLSWVITLGYKYDTE